MVNGEQLLTADEILGMDDIPTEEVVVPEWQGRMVLVCGMTAAGKNSYEASLVEIKGTTRKVRMENATAKLLVRTLVNRQRQPLFTESQIEKLGTKSAAALERLAQVALRLSSMRVQDVEELVKNSDAAQSGDSPSVSL
jgi:hypothetical protein